MPSFLTALVQKTTEVFSTEYWKGIFTENYGNSERTAVIEMDDAFFNLLERGEHEFLAQAIIAKPEGFCRPQRITTFMVGTSIEKHRVGDGIVQTSKNYPPAPTQLANLVGEAVGRVLMSRLEKLGRNNQKVPLSFWDLKPGTKEYKSEIASQLSVAMNGLLNIAEGTQDQEGLRELCQFFRKLFGTLPRTLNFRVMNALAAAAAQKPAPVPGPTKTVSPVVDGGGRKRSRQPKKPEDKEKGVDLSNSNSDEIPTVEEYLQAQGRGPQNHPRYVEASA